MLQLFSTIIKEYLILIRDRSGMAILFVMPVALVTIMALVQDAPFRDYQELKVPALIVNYDKGELGKKIANGIDSAGIFQLTRSQMNEHDVKSQISSGKYEIGIVIPENASARLNHKVDYFVNNTLSEMGLTDSVATDTLTDDLSSSVAVYFKPGIKKSFKNSVLSAMKQVTAKLESESLLRSFKTVLNPEGDTAAMKDENFGDFISFNERSALDTDNGDRQLNSVQHNVPAWTMFGMFFIVISLAGSIIKEREDGSYLRIRTIPVSYLVVLTGKIVAYLSVCLIQCALMLMVGVWMLPMMGLPELIFGNSFLAVLVVAICAGLAATGYGVLVGTVFNTHQQSSTFGSVSVVIMAALGGIWVPVFVMPEAIQYMAEFSPLYWGLNAFQLIFLGNGTLAPVASYVYKLLLFFAVTLLAALFVNKFKNN